MRIAIPAIVRTHKWKFTIGTAVVVGLGLIVANAVGPAEPEYVTAVSEKTDLRQTVEAIGTVISEHDLKLQFASNGVVGQVNVVEGQRVRAGQTLASLKAGNYSADINSANAELQSAQAQLQALVQGARPEDIAITEADVANKRSSLETARTSLKSAEESLLLAQQKLETLKNEAYVGLSGTVTSARSSVLLQLTAAENALSRVADVFNNNDVQDAVIKNSSHELNEVMAMMQTVNASIDTLSAKVSVVADYESAIKLLSDGKTAIINASVVANKAFNVISTLPETSSFTSSARETYKTTLATQRTNVQTALSAIDTALTGLQDAAATYTTRIATEESTVATSNAARAKALTDINIYETALRTAEAQLTLKKAPARQTDIVAAQARVNQARASLQRARSNYENNLIIAPIGGTVTKVNIKAGEFSPAGPAITMLGDSPFRVEMYVSEIDIPKVQLTQSGSVELDAYRGTHFKLRVSEVDRAATNKEGVSKYRVKLDFVYPHNELKIGMTGDAEIVTGLRPGVVTVPSRAVLERDDGTRYVRVINGDGESEEKTVTVGMEGEGGDLEVVSGLTDGETVVVLVKK